MNENNANEHFKQQTPLTKTETQANASLPFWPSLCLVLALARLERACRWDLQDNDEPRARPISHSKCLGWKEWRQRCFTNNRPFNAPPPLSWLSDTATAAAGAAAGKYSLASILPSSYRMAGTRRWQRRQKRRRRSHPLTSVDNERPEASVLVSLCIRSGTS